MDQGESSFKGRYFIDALNRRLGGHYNYYNVCGNIPSCYRFYKWAVECAFKWLNRRGGKRESFTLPVFINATERLGIAKPKMLIVKRQHRIFS
jgi:RNA-directed DNA polymerase